MTSLCHNELTCQCVYISSTFCFSAFITVYDILIPPDFLECMYHQLTPHTHDLALFHQTWGGGVIFPFFSYLFYLFYLVLILWMWLEGNFAYGTSALLPWHVYTSVVNQLESHYSDQQPIKWSVSEWPLLFVNTEALPHGTCSNPSPAAVNMAA